jgi:hypothetical protein
VNASLLQGSIYEDIEEISSRNALIIENRGEKSLKGHYFTLITELLMHISALFLALPCLERVKADFVRVLGC